MKVHLRYPLLAILLGGMLAVVHPAPALAGGGASVTLSASASKIDAGQHVTLVAEISPAAGGETVDIVDEGGNVIASDTTGAAGRVTADLQPTANITLRARWSGERSDRLSIGVRVVVRVRLDDVRLFGIAAVEGTVRPANPGAAVTVTLRHAGRVVATRRPEMGSAGRFATEFPIEKTGAYRTVATFADADHLEGTATAGPRFPPLPRLRSGSRGKFVTLLERRLRELAYHLPGVNRRYDKRTGDAVMAFRKLQGMRRLSTIDAAVWKALASPRRPTVRSRANDTHIEVNQSRQVLTVVNDGRVTGILHVSTGKPSTPTRNGRFHVYRKLAGTSGSGLYYPSYFDGLRAIHGWPDVPSYAASHGCVRAPMWAAKWIFRVANMGMRVLVYR